MLKRKLKDFKEVEEVEEQDNQQQEQELQKQQQEKQKVPSLSNLQQILSTLIFYMTNYLFNLVSPKYYFRPQQQQHQQQLVYHKEKRSHPPDYYHYYCHHHSYTSLKTDQETATMTKQNKEFHEKVISSPVMFESEVEHKKKHYMIALYPLALVLSLKDKKSPTITSNNSTTPPTPPSYIKMIHTSAITGTTLDHIVSTRVSLHTCVNTGDEKRELRTRKTLVFNFGNADSAKGFMDAVDRLLSDLPAGHPKNRSVRVILNPKSGKRLAESIFKEIEHLFKEAKMKVKKTVTKGPEHAKQIGYKFKLNKYDTIVFVSGDGLFHEFINGLLARDDWEEARKVRLSLIPAGTGNGIACSLGLGDPMSSALACLRGGSRPLDVSVIRQDDKHKWASILSLTWGLVSDVDIESERFRSLGALRLQLGAAIRILNLRVYKGKISYLPALETEKQEFAKLPKCAPSCDICKSSDSVETIKNILTNSQSGINVNGSNTNITNGNGQTSPSLNSSSSNNDITKATTTNTTTNTSPDNSSMETPTTATETTTTTSSEEHKHNNHDHHNHDHKEENGKVEEANPLSPSSPSTSTTTTTTTTNASPNNNGKIITRDIVVPLPKLPNDETLLQDDVQLSSEWRTIEGEFIGFIASTVSHLSADFIASPYAHYSDGFIEMILIRHNPKISKFALASILTDAETGKHIDSPFIEHYKVKSLVLQPGKLDRDGILAVDGERVPYGKTSMECIRGCINLVCKVEY